MFYAKTEQRKHTGLKFESPIWTDSLFSFAYVPMQHRLVVSFFSVSCIFLVPLLCPNLCTSRELLLGFHAPTQQLVRSFSLFCLRFPVFFVSLLVGAGTVFRALSPGSVSAVFLALFPRSISAIASRSLVFFSSSVLDTYTLHSLPVVLLFRCISLFGLLHKAPCPPFFFSLSHKRLRDSELRFVRFCFCPLVALS